MFINQLPALQLWRRLPVLVALLDIAIAAPIEAAWSPLSIQWVECAKSSPKLQCAKLEVPIDYSNPSGSKTTLALARLRTNGTNRLGSVIYNPGGP